MNKGQKACLTVKSLRKKISHIIDPATILRMKPTDEVILLESADNITKRGEKSLMFFDLALKLEARDNRVTITALIKEAMPLLLALKREFADAVTSESVDSLVLSMSPLYHYLDLLEKIRARSALDVLRRTISLMSVVDEDFQKDLMLAGAFSYDFLDHFESLPKARMDRANVPDFIFYLPLTVIVIDHIAKETTILAHELANDFAKSRLDQAALLIEKAGPYQKINLGTHNVDLSYDVDIPDHDFMQLVERCKEYILAGDVYQIVPSRNFSLPIGDHIRTYQTLRYMNPSPYMFFMRTTSWNLFGASPETFIKVDDHGQRVSIRPIAGTRRRGFLHDGSIDDELDSREQASLCLDEKELAEHMMLVDLARNDIATVSIPSSRRIKRLLAVDRFSHVMHLVSEVEGRLLEGFDALKAYQASMNMGTLMGAPKVRAAELLRELEPSKRGFYGGAVGYIAANGDMDTAIIIRSALVRGNLAQVRAGCGVVFDSCPKFETRETINKAEAVLRAIAISGGL